MNEKIRSFRVWGLLALPLAAVVVVALMLAWGHGSSDKTEALNKANSPDIYAACTSGPLGPAIADTNATGSATCSFPAGTGFTIAAILGNLGANFPMGHTGYQYRLAFSAGLTMKNRPGVTETSAFCSSDFPIAGISVESKDVGSYLGGCSFGPGDVPAFPPAQNRMGEVDFNCSATPSVESVTLVHGEPLESLYANHIGVAFVDPDGTETITILCTPPDEQININLQADDQVGKKLGFSCWIVSADVNVAPPGSPPVLVNTDISGISDNNAVAPCNLGPLANDTDPSIGNIRVTIPGALRVTIGDSWHVRQAAPGVSLSEPNLTYNFSPAKFNCDLSAGKCTVNATNTRKDGNLRVNVSDAVGAAIPAQCVDIFSDPPANTVLFGRACDNNYGNGETLVDSNPAVGSIQVSNVLAGAYSTDLDPAKANAQIPGGLILPGTKQTCDVSLGVAQACKVNYQIVAARVNVDFNDVKAGGLLANQCVTVYSDPPTNSVVLGVACDGSTTAGGPKNVDFDDANAAAGQLDFFVPFGTYGIEYNDQNLPANRQIKPAPANKQLCAVPGPPGATECDIKFAFDGLAPFNLVTPALANLFMTAQGAKLPPASCNASTDDQTITYSVRNAPGTPDPKDPADGQDNDQDGLTDERQVIHGFQFDVWFDDQWICVNIDRGGYVVNNPQMFCVIDDKNNGQQLDGWARIFCATNGKMSPNTVNESNLELAKITVSPQPELYSQIVANQDNGIAVQVLVKNCNLTDEHGHPIATQGDCTDSAVTIRWLEGDVNGDCVVNASDGQTLAFRWGAEVGSLLYNNRFDLEPSGTAKFDGDIDIKDVQFVFGRQGSVCSKDGKTGTQPAQPPHNPKQSNP